MIILFLNNFNSGGAERAFLTLASLLKAKNKQFKVIALSDFGALRSDYEKIAKVEVLPRSYLWRFFSLIKIILGNHSYKYLCNCLESSIYLAVIGSLVGRQKKITLRLANNIDNINDRSAFKRISIKFIIRNFYHRFKIIANSYSTLEDYQTINKAISGKVIPNPINLNNFFRVREHRASTSKIIKACSVARLHQQKNINFLIEIVEYLARNQVPISLEIVGDGPERNKLEQRSIGLPINFIEPPIDISEFFKDKDVFLLFPEYEGFGNVYVEALAAGLPLVTWRCKGGMNEIVERLSPESIFEDRSSEAIARGVCTIFSNPKMKRLHRRPELDEFDFLSPDSIVTRYLTYVCSE